jgi:psp operon transcriptional activator
MVNRKTYTGRTIRSGNPALTDLIGNSESFLIFQERLSKVAQIDRPVLIIGERGTGKELAAIRLHYLSRRWQEPFVTINCAALAPGLVESELFGHEAGAFTGAVSQRKGRFEFANHGTLFLDEIGNMPLNVQEKILRVIEYGVFERVGSSRQINVDVRIIAATNANLPQKADEGTFKKDLLDRLSFEVLVLPSLKERGDDILLLADHFAARVAIELNIDPVPAFSAKVKKQLMEYPWPGNVRECKNVIERAVYQANGKRIDSISFNPFKDTYSCSEKDRERDRQKEKIDITKKTLTESKRELEYHYLTEALKRTKHNQREAAKLLGITYHQFRGLYRKYQDMFTAD